MDFVETIAFSKKFPSCRPKVFKGFVEWGIFDNKTDGYIVLADTELVKKTCINELEDYVKSHKLRIDQGKDYMIICSRC
jgi:hypothetical protein